MHPYTLLSLVVVVTVVGAGLFDEGKKKDEHKNGILKNLPNLEKFKAKLEKWRQAKTSDFIAKKSKIRKPFGRQHKSKRSSVGDKPITLKELNEELLDVLYEGDIALSEDQVDNLLKQIDEVQRGKRQAIVGNGVKWTMPINYYFTSSISDASTQQLIREALKFWQEHTCVSFAENAAATPRVAFIKDNGCYSYVGRIASWTEQNISIGNGCEHFGIITHEVNHMLGVYHQQSRYDRDNFVYIDVSNVVAGFEHNYDKYTSTDTDNYQVPYDYGSVMHYAEEDFAADPTKPVMIAFDPLYQNTMGQRTGPSFNDILLVNQHYGCLNQCPTSLVCQNGGFQNPANCTKCICPGGFWGSLCEQRDPGSNPGICGSTVQATCDWQTLNGSAGSNVALLNTFPSSCWWHIQAPQGQQIEIQFQNAGGFCSSGCFYGAVEAKMGKFENVGYRFCCPDDLPNSDLFTDSNLAIIGASSRYLTQSFTLMYRIKNGCVTEETTTVKTTTAIPSETTKASTPTTSTTTTSASTTTHAATTSTSTTTTAPTTTATQTTAPTTTTTTPSTTTKKHGCKKCCRCQSSESSESSEECDHHRRHRHHRHHSCGCEEEETTTTAPTTTTQASTTTVFTCDKASLDLVFVVDASGSIGIDNFNKTLDALIATVANITIGPNDDQSHIGMVTFADVAPPQAPYKVFGLGDYLDVASVQVAISQTYYIDGGTDIESGMTKALTDVFGNPGDRATVPDIMIVITDGQDFSNVTGAQQVAASRGITVFSVGVGAYVDYNQLVAIAGSTDRAYNATNFDFLDEILADICGNLGGSNSTNSVIAPRLPFSSAIAPKTCAFDVKSGFTKQEFCTARPYCHQIC